MGIFKKIISSVLVLLLIIIGAVLISAGLRSHISYDILLLMNYYQVQIAVLILGIVLIIAAIILLSDIIASGNRDSQYLVDDEHGSILVTKRSLESTLRLSVNRFSDVDYTKGDVKIYEQNRIVAECFCDVFRDDRIDILGQKIQREVENSLREVTGISDVKAIIHLNKTQRAQRKEIR